MRREEGCVEKKMDGDIKHDLTAKGLSGEEANETWLLEDD